MSAASDADACEPAADLHLSEVHDGLAAAARPSSDAAAHSTSFAYCCPHLSAQSQAWLDSLAVQLLHRPGEAPAASAPAAGGLQDCDGDLDPPRRRGGASMGPDQTGPSGCLRIQHSLATGLPDVGLQVWKGALLLCDLLLALGPRLAGVTAVELGAGTGLPGILLSRFAGPVFLTDAPGGALANCARNAAANAQPGSCGARVRALDWAGPLPWEAAASPGSCEPRFAWTAADLRALSEAQLLLAADTVYDDSATDAFLACAAALMRRCAAQPQRGCPGPVLLAAVERRVNFAAGDMRPRAHAFERFLAGLACHGLAGGPLEVCAVPHSFCYERGGQLELWLLRADTSAQCEGGGEAKP